MRHCFPNFATRRAKPWKVPPVVCAAFSTTFSLCACWGFNLEASLQLVPAIKMSTTSTSANVPDK